MDPILWAVTVYGIGFGVFTVKALTLGAATYRSVVVGLRWPYIVGKFIANA